MSESELQSAVLELASLLGWRTMHQRPGLTQAGHWRTATQGDGKGWPDLVLVKDRVLFVELKSTKGKLADEQAAWLAALHHAGAWVEVWRPEHWTNGHIERILRDTTPPDSP